MYIAFSMRKRDVAPNLFSRLAIPSMFALSLLLFLPFHGLFNAKNPSMSPTSFSIFKMAAIKHGFVRKSGVLPFERWHPNFQETRRAIFLQWLKEKGGAQFTAEKLPVLPPLFPGCEVWVNHNYKIIYLRHPKSASSSVLRMLGDCQDGGMLKGASSLSRAVQRRMQKTCLQTLAPQVEDMGDDEIESMWQTYFVFTMVRNPFDRMLSSYNFLLQFMKAGCGKVDEAAEWDSFCQDPLSLGRVCQTSPECCTLPHEFFWHHIVDQGRCFSLSSGAPAVDYIGRVENFEEDMREVYRTVDKKVGMKPQLMRHTAMRRSNNVDRNCSQTSLTRRREAMVAEGVKVPYEAPNIRPVLCDEDEYFSENYMVCKRAAMEFYRDDFELLFPSSDYSK